MSGLWLSVLLYVVWTIVLALSIILWRVLDVTRGRKAATDFPAGEKHGEGAYWRLNRAHANVLESLPVIIGLAVVATFNGLTEGMVATLAMVAFYARVGQSLVHVASGSALAVNARFGLFMVQLVCFLWIAREIVVATGLV